MKYTSERKWYINLLWFFFALIGMFVIPSYIYIGLNTIISNEIVCELLSNTIFIIILYIVYFKDLNKEFKTYKKKLSNNLKIGFKYYFVGLGLMLISNLIINLAIGNISANETLVREMLYSNPVYTLISIIIIAPITEEIIFRKSLMPLIKNKWIYALSCGLLFGGAHLISGPITLINLVYLIPYGSLGFVFALMNYETKTTFTSMTMHCVHNTITALLLLAVYFSGAV